MNASEDRSRTLNVWTRLLATIAVACAASATVFFASGTVKAIGFIDRTDDSLVELSHYISDAHASIRNLVAEAGSRDEAIADFNASVDRRLARMRSASTQFNEQKLMAVLTRPLQGDGDVQHIDEARWAYVDAAKTTLATPVYDPERSLRLFDLQAQKLIQTVAAVRDSAAAARARNLLANDTTAAASSGVGALLIAYLIWLPVFRVRKEPSAIL
jgi:hypothetical protein